MMRQILIVSSLLVFSATAFANIRPAQRHEATGNKSGKYYTDGFFAGGERSVTSAKLKDVRRAKSVEGFERIVLDLQTNPEDSNSIPYFQVQLSPNEQRMVLSIWANIQYDFDAARVQKAFAKSALVKKLTVVPRVEDGLTIVEFALKPVEGKAPKFEVFRLSKPPRIIVDAL